MKKNFTYIIASVGILIVSSFLVIKVAPDFLAAINSKSGLEKIPLAPDVSLKGLNTTVTKLSQYRGKKVVLIFWTSWNERAYATMRLLHDYALRFAPQDVHMLAINSQESFDQVAKIALKDSASFTTLLDTEGEAGELYGITVAPLIVFIDASGLEIRRMVGPISIKDFEEIMNSF